MTYTVLFSELFLIVGLIAGWLASERYLSHMSVVSHDFDNLFEKNPHPEIYDENGKVNKGEYISINFDLGYDPEDFDPEDISEEG